MARTIASGLRRPRQVRAVAARGWTREKRRSFLDMLSVTCNVRLACATAEMSPRSAYHLRRRDPEFDALWREALAMGYDRLEERLLRQAGAGVNDVDFGSGDAPEAPLDPVLALNLLRSHRPTIEGQRKRVAGAIVRATRDEAEAALNKRLDALERRLKAERSE